MSVRIRQKPPESGIWWLFINHKGRRRSKKIGSSKAHAVKIAKQVEADLANGELTSVKKVKTFEQYCKIWIEEHVPVNNKRSTADDYKSIVKNHLEGSPFYKAEITRITKTDLTRFLNRKRKNRAASTVKHIKQCCSAVFTAAMDDDLINKNPCSGIKVANGDKKEHTAYNREEVESLLAAFKGHHYHTMLLFFLRTGCRSSEVAAMKWIDIDLAKRTATIRRGWVRGKIENMPKSKKPRTIDLTPDLVNQLREHRKAQLADSDQKGTWVFQNRAGGMVDMNNFRKRIYNPMVAKAGLKPSRLHDLRHTYASILIDATGNMKYTQQQLGHHSIQITVDLYQHLLEGDGEVRLVDVLDAQIRTPAAPKTKKEQVNGD